MVCLVQPTVHCIVNTMVHLLLQPTLYCKYGSPTATDPPPAKMTGPANQSPGNKKEITTKHDSVVCGRRNVKMMEKVILSFAPFTSFIYFIVELRFY